MTIRSEQAPLEGEPLLTPAEVSAMLHVDRKTLDRWEKNGALAKAGVTVIRLPSRNGAVGHKRYRPAEIRAITHPEEQAS